MLIAAASVELLAIAIWAGGLTALGAVAAPLVFGIVPLPASADAMTAVFVRFDRIAMACAALALAAEAVLNVRGGKSTRLDVARGAALVLSGALAIIAGAWLSPAIAALHQAGAVRGVGDEGMALEHHHRIVEAAGKTELALLAIVVVLLVTKLARGVPGPPPSAT
jgi:hypothetical protein